MDLNDLEAIRRLTHLYSYHIDHFELEPVLSLWTEDAIFDETGVGLRCWHGINEIRQSFTEIFAVMKSHVHYTSNFILLEQGRDFARGTSYFLAEGVVQSGGSVHATGYYQDEYAKTANGWRFKSRRAFFFNPPDLGAYKAEAETL